ncbi:hypothetical protein EHQ47_16750 [Leptospira bourretii]|uniref:hypothetical protein n=1 Tax=Leptospira bourretii TaxID=2484962 RepID=UPI0010910B97|nr:hypothetical protein [Leptospira bourretii]TGL19745.1 hypothetical protein EHQ47_16750 [Leptospira bourretii]
MDYKKILNNKIQEYFPDVKIQEKVFIELEKCRFEDWKIEKDRVFLSIIKCSNGNIDRIKQLVTVANKDYRDVLAWAENPNKMKQGFTTNKKEYLELEKKDKEQFNNWLKS